MAIQKFWSAIQYARSLFFGRMNESVDEGRPADTASLLDAVTQTADVWLNPAVLKDYDEADFGFLPAAERAKLRQAIEEFRRLAADVPCGAPTPAQIKQGYELFATINNALAPTFGEERDLQRIVDVTRHIERPKYLLGTDFRIGIDSTDDPAVWIRFIVPDDAEIESPTFQAETNQLREAFRTAILRAGIDRWPYITVRTKSEVKDRIGGYA